MWLPCRAFHDRHTLAKVITAMTEQIGVSLRGIFTETGYRGHNAPKLPELRVYTAGQKRGVTDSATLRCQAGDRVSQGQSPYGPQLPGRMRGRGRQRRLAAAGYNFMLLLVWLKTLLCPLTAALIIKTYG